ncbi:hypothetical protein QBC42DRAFT_291459 [Cladorrhinum samala]|uniref:Uncharacterized protein n=1 Tax=Cladorrhinum samala TaxID=585594 RepID=A0AAV9HAC9_9PEZI|nr:hypothetical protein QBC42DRAFT_291459 [Cladorrhinum samala]
MGHGGSKLAAGTHMPAETAARGFPRRFDATFKMSLSRIMALLTDPNHPDGPAYAVSWVAGWYGNMIFHGGPTKDHAPLATARSAGKLGRDFNVTLPAGPGAQEQGPGRTEILRYSPSFRHETWWFAMQVGGDGPHAAHVERFEWRRSRGAEVKAVEGGSGWGLKLVRMGPGSADLGHASASDDGEDREGPDGPDGRTSDGKEVVAVWADAGMSLSRMGTLEYRGSGATGELGLAWSVMAAATCMCLWQLRQQRNLAVATTAAAT